MADKFKVPKVLEIVKAAGLRLLLSVAIPYDDHLVWEVVANLTKNFGNETSKR